MLESGVVMLDMVVLSGSPFFFTMFTVIDNTFCCLGRGGGISPLDILPRVSMSLEDLDLLGTPDPSIVSGQKEELGAAAYVSEFHLVEAEDHGATEAVQTEVLHGRERGDFLF